MDLGYRSLTECREHIPSSEFTEWIAYYENYPWNSGFALVAAMLGNIHRDRKARSEPFRISEFIPGFKRRDEETADPGLGLFARLRAHVDAKHIDTDSQSGSGDS